jgi:ATP-dependent DNA helicase RecG
MKCEISDVLPRESMLKNLSCAGVGRDGGLSYTNAGLLFFRDNRQNLYFDFTHVICALYKGTDKVDIIDAKHFDGSIMENIDNAMVFLKRNLRVRYEIKTLQRKNILELPEDALREAVTNAVCHRDYFEKGSRVMVEIFDDRVEVTNPGGAPKGITEDNFGSVSITRNPIIASLLHRAHYIERMGTGIGRIRNAAKEANVAEPVFELNHFFKVTFKRNELSISISSQLTPDRYNVDTSDTTHVTDNAGNSAYGGINSTDGSLNGGISIACGGLNNGNRAIVLGILKNEPTVTMADISRHASIPVRTVERIMAALKKDGLVERAGSKKSGYWLVLSE